LIISPSDQTLKHADKNIAGEIGLVVAMRYKTAGYVLG